MPTRKRNNSRIRRKTQRSTPRKIRGGGKGQKNKNKTAKSAMDMSSLFDGLPSIRPNRIVKPSAKQLAQMELSAQKTISKSVKEDKKKMKEDKKKMKEQTAKENDDLSHLFGKL